MQKFEKSFKTWTFQHGMLPRLLWSLLVNDVSLSTVEEEEKKITAYLRRWLGVSQFFNSVNLYRKDCKFQLSISSTTEEFETDKGPPVDYVESQQRQQN